MPPARRHGRDRSRRVLPPAGDVGQPLPLHGALGGMFARLWGLNASQLQTVFPQAKTRDLRLV